ncbi:unnamed protein product, partial [Polarella glacialis]
YPHRRDAAVQAINRHFLDEERGRWHQMISEELLPVGEAPFSWIHFAPAMLDLAAFGVVYPDELALRMQEALQVMSGPDSGAVREFEVTPGRLMPGIGFQASLAWRHLDANEAATQHLNWCETRSSLWQLQPDRNKAVGGWIDWVDEVGGQAPCWQRFIDTSAYHLMVTQGLRFHKGLEEKIPANQEGNFLLRAHGDLLKYVNRLTGCQQIAARANGPTTQLALRGSSRALSFEASQLTNTWYLCGPL